nr:reverse transcriptase domain-containing protein [Tanacetum cinerariifolium]
DDGDDEEESSVDEEDDEMDIEADEEEEDEHPAPVDSVVVAPTAADQAPSAEETEPFEIDESAATSPPHPAYRMTARISIPAPVPMPAWTDSEVARLLAISSPPASPLSPWSSPPPQIPFPPLPPILSPPSPVLSPAPPPSPIHSLGYRAAMIRLRDEAASTLPPLQLPSASHREDRPEVTLPPRKRLDIALGPRYKVGESSSAAAARPAGGFRADYGFVATVDREIMRDLEREVGYGITDSWNEIVETLQGAPVSTDTELGGYVREFENTSRTTQNQQQQQHSNKRQNTGRVYTTASGGMKQYGGSKPLCAKCNYHHDGPCAPKCHNCNKIGHSASDCRSSPEYVPESDFKMHQEDDDDEDPEEDPVDYPADGGDDG